jgi:hypothetical protein
MSVDGLRPGTCTSNRSRRSHKLLRLIPNSRRNRRAYPMMSSGRSRGGTTRMLICTEW